MDHESIARASRLVREADHRLAAAGVSLSAAQYDALCWLANSPARCTLGNLAEYLAVTPAVITGLVDRLEKRRAVEREPDTAGDRRRTFLRVTPRGRDLLARAAAALAEPAETDRRAA